MKSQNQLATNELKQTQEEYYSQLISAHTLSDFPSLQSAGPWLRKPTEGPEYSLVCEYVRSQQLTPAPRGQSLTIFVEPRIESGFPDIVAVYWHEATARRWSMSRAELTKSDIRVLHYLAIGGVADLPQMKTFFTSGVTKSLERLHDAGLVRLISGNWRARSLRKIFAVRRLVAIEAKIDKWPQGLQQAFQNTWFASESYLLVPHIPKSSRLIEDAARLGIGVVAYHQSLDSSEISARQEQIPKSYASWLFNEWAWRAKCIDVECPQHK